MYEADEQDTAALRAVLAPELMNRVEAIIEPAATRCWLYEELGYAAGVEIGRRLPTVPWSDRKG
jgi:hypothetical protein